MVRGFPKRVPPLLLLLQLLVQLPSCAALAAGPSASLDVPIASPSRQPRPRSLPVLDPPAPVCGSATHAADAGAAPRASRARRHADIPAKAQLRKGSQDGGLRFSIASEQPTGDDDDEMVVLTSAPATERVRAARHPSRLTDLGGAVHQQALLGARHPRGVSSRTCCICHRTWRRSRPLSTFSKTSSSAGVKRDPGGVVLLQPQTPVV